MIEQAETSGRDRLIFEFEPLVKRIARVLTNRYSLTRTSYDEMISAGYVALVEAAENTKLNSSKTFRAYASIRIRGAMIDTLRGSSVLSRKSHRFVKAMHAMQYLREQDLLETDILRDSKQSPGQRLARVLDIAGKGALAFQLSASEIQSEVEEVPDQQRLPDESLIRQNQRARLEEMVDSLPEKERSIIRQYYFEDKPFVAIANENQGMNKSWVSKLHSRALERLREAINETPL